MGMPMFDLENNSRFQGIAAEYKPVIIWCVYTEGKIDFMQAQTLLAKYCDTEKDYRFWVDTCADSGRD